MTLAEEAWVDARDVKDPPEQGEQVAYCDKVAATAGQYGARPAKNAFEFADGSAIGVLEPWGDARMYLRDGCP